MERRLSVALASAGLIAALGLLLLGRKSSPDEVRAAAAELSAVVRETAAGVQARADTLAQLPRLGWAVATDESTMHDLTTDELAFRTHPGEHIEITQMKRGGGEPRRLLRLPADSDVDLPVLLGTHVVVRANRPHLVTVVSVEPRQRADEIVGVLAVAKELDTSAIEQRLAARGVNAELRTIQGSVTLAGTAPGGSIGERVALTGPAAEGTELVAANLGGRPRWPRIASPLILLLSLLGAAVLWRRGAASPAHVEGPFATLPPPARSPTPPPAPPPARSPTPPPAPPPARSPTPAPAPPRSPTPLPAPARLPTPPPLPSLPPPSGSRANAPTPVVGLPAEDQSDIRSQLTPAVGHPGHPAEPAAPVRVAPRERSFSGRVDISLARSGSVSVSPRGAGAPPMPADPSADVDPRIEEYRSLFSEFVKLRRTTGEPVEGLEFAQFVATLREKRAAIMQQIPVKDVRFKLAFQNGKAAIRYQTIS